MQLMSMERRFVPKLDFLDFPGDRICLVMLMCAVEDLMSRAPPS
jgi:hypothetical protein